MFSLLKIGSHTNVKKLSLPYYLPLAGRRIFGFIPFLRVLARWEMQTASLRVWTRVSMSISYVDNNSTTSASRHSEYVTRKSVSMFK